MEISTPRQLLRSLGPLPEASARTPPELPRSPSRGSSSHETGWRILLKECGGVLCKKRSLVLDVAP